MRRRRQTTKHAAAREANDERLTHKRRREMNPLEDDEENAAKARLCRVAETRDRNAQLQMQSLVVTARKRQKTRSSMYVSKMNVIWLCVI